VWLDRDGTRISSLDLLGRRFVLPAGRDGADWVSAAKRVSTALSIEIEALRIGCDVLDVTHRWHRAYGVSPAGAVLVRPDGFVAWRAKGRSISPEDALALALAQLLARPAPVAIAS
jgi:putative polyketide hydroxylase